MNKNRDEKAGNGGLAIGMCLGLAVGTAIGAASHNIGLWLPVGLCVGLAVGTAFDRGGEEGENAAAPEEKPEGEPGHEDDPGKKDPGEEDS